MREWLKKYGFPVFWIVVGALNASAIWFGYYMYDRHRYALIESSIAQCTGSWDLYGESTVVGLRLKCEGKSDG